MAQNIRKNLVATIITSATAVPLGLDPLIQPLYANVLPTQAPRFAGTGGAGGYIYSVLAGGAPTGMTFNANGTLTGTPTTQGSFPITVQVQDSLGQQFARSFVIVVTAPLFVLQGGRDPTPASRTNPYSFQFRAADAFGSTAGITYTIVSGALPTGITLTGATGVIAGTPTVLGISYFRVRATKAGVGFIEWSTQLNVLQNISAIGTTLVTPPELRNMVVGVPVNAQFTFTNLAGIPPYTLLISSGSLPAGLVMDTQGNVTGTPTTPTPAAYTQPQITVMDMIGNSFTGNAVLNVGSQLRSSATQGQFYTTDNLGRPQAVDYLSQYFGSQVDGAVTINASNNYAAFASLTGGVNNMLRPMFASTLTITGTGKLNNNGYDIYCDTLDISNAGLNGIFCSASPTGSILPAAVSRAAGPWGSGGGVGVAGGINAGTTGNAGETLPCGVSGGALGGTGGPGNPGGLGPVAPATFPTYQTVPRTLLENCIAQVYNGIAAGITANACIPIGGGCGGGSGGGGGGNGGVGAGAFSGNGGGGGGRIRIFARNIIRGASTAAGAINCSAFKGQAGTNGPAANRGAGGGGAGGGGGYIYIVYVTLQGSVAANALRASGGDGGNGGASGGAGSTLGQGGDGGPGGAIIIIDMLSSSVAITQGVAGGAHSGVTGGTGNLFQASL